MFKEVKSTMIPYSKEILNFIVNRRLKGDAINQIHYSILNKFKVKRSKLSKIPDNLFNTQSPLNNFWAGYLINKINKTGRFHIREKYTAEHEVLLVKLLQYFGLIYKNPCITEDQGLKRISIYFSSNNLEEKIRDISLNPKFPEYFWRGVIVGICKLSGYKDYKAIVFRDKSLGKRFLSEFNEESMVVKETKNTLKIAFTGKKTLGNIYADNSFTLDGFLKNILLL